MATEKEKQKELKKLFRDIDKKFKTTTSETVIKSEPNLMEKLEELKKPKLQAMFLLAVILSCISFTATPAIFFLLCKYFGATN